VSCKGRKRPGKGELARKAGKQKVRPTQKGKGPLRARQTFEEGNIFRCVGWKTRNGDNLSGGKKTTRNWRTTGARTAEKWGKVKLTGRKSGGAKKSRTIVKKPGGDVH